MTLELKLLNTESTCIHNASLSKNENMYRICRKAEFGLFPLILSKSLKTLQWNPRYKKRDALREKRLQESIKRF